jgi:hypothetical protein
MGTMTVGTYRVIAAVVWVAGIVGMIVASANGNNNGWVITCGLFTALASIVLLSVSSTQTNTIDVFEQAEVEHTASQVEGQIDGLVAAGADEQAVRSLVRDASRLGRRR